MDGWIQISFSNIMIYQIISHYYIPYIPNKTNKQTQPQKYKMYLDEVVDNDTSSKLGMTTLLNNDDVDERAVPGTDSATYAARDVTGTKLNLNLLQGNILKHAESFITTRPFSLQNKNRREMDEPFSLVEAMTVEGMYSETPLPSNPGSSSNQTPNPNQNLSNPTYYIGVKNEKIKQLEKELNALTADYTTQYNLYSSDLMTRNQYLQNNAEYLNKIVVDTSGVSQDASGATKKAYYYINKYGFTHKYNSAAIEKNDASSCPAFPMIGNPAVVNDDALKKVAGVPTRFAKYDGPDMSPGQPCLAGVNVQKDGTQEYAWVDIRGQKHVYNRSAWSEDYRDSSCRKQNVGDPLVLSAAKYDAIPTDTNNPMTTTSVCYKTNSDPSLYDNLMTLNKKINAVVSQISEETQHIANASAKLEGDVKEAELRSNTAIEAANAATTASKNTYADPFYKLYGQSEGFRYAFWSVIILIGILLVFRLFIGGNGGGGSEGNGLGGSDSGIISGSTGMYGIVIISLLFIAVLFYLSQTNFKDYQYSTSKMIQ